jgi:hypothetical protein
LNLQHLSANVSIARPRWRYARKGEKEGGKEGGREGGKEGGREGGREGGSEGRSSSRKRKVAKRSCLTR